VAQRRRLEQQRLRDPGRAADHHGQPERGADHRHHRRRHAAGQLRRADRADPEHDVRPLRHPELRGPVLRRRHLDDGRQHGGQQPRLQPVHVRAGQREPGPLVDHRRGRRLRARRRAVRVRGQPQHVAPDPGPLPPAGRRRQRARPADREPGPVRLERRHLPAVHQRRHHVQEGRRRRALRGRRGPRRSRHRRAGVRRSAAGGGLAAHVQRVPDHRRRAGRLRAVAGPTLHVDGAGSAVDGVHVVDRGAAPATCS
jgi:hypothetical protein